MLLLLKSNLRSFIYSKSTGESLCFFYRNLRLKKATILQDMVKRRFFFQYERPIATKPANRKLLSALIWISFSELRNMEGAMIAANTLVGIKLELSFNHSGRSNRFANAKKRNRIPNVTANILNMIKILSIG